MNKFSRVKKVLSLIMGITNFNLMNVEAVKKVKGKKVVPSSKTIFSAKKSVLEKKSVSDTFDTKKKANFNKKGNKKKNIGLKSIKSVKNNAKMNSSQKKRALRLLHNQNVAPKANGGYFIDKNGKLRWKNVGIASALGVPTLGAVGTGIGVSAKKIFGSKENTSTVVSAGQQKPNTVNNHQENANEYYAGNSNNIQGGNNNLKSITNNSTANSTANVSTQYNSFTSDLQSTTVQQASFNQNNDLPAESYEEAFKLVEKAFKSEILPKGDPISLKADFSGSTPDSNKGNGYNGYKVKVGDGYEVVKADEVYHSKKIQHNLKLFLWKQLPKSALSMTANKFEVWLALRFLENENLNGNFFGHEFTFGDGDNKVSIKLDRSYNIHWNLGKNIGNDVRYRYGNEGNFNTSEGGIVEKFGKSQKVLFSYEGNTTYGNILGFFKCAKMAYDKQLEAAIRSCINWEKIEIEERKFLGHEDSYLKHLYDLGGKEYNDVVNSIKSTLCSKNVKTENGVVKFSASGRLEDLANNKEAMNFLRMVSLVRYFGLYISFGYKFDEKNKLNDSLKQLISAVVMASIDRLYDLSDDTYTIRTGLWKCGGIIDPKNMIDYGLGTVYRVVGNAGEGYVYIG